METASQLSMLLGLAWLTPLVAFVAILFFGPRMGHHGKNAAWVSTAAIVASLMLSLAAMGTWLAAHPVQGVVHAGHVGHAEDSHAESHEAQRPAAVHAPVAYSGDWYTLYQGGNLKLTIGWYIDALTVLMFVVVTCIATC
ncbi:MAG: hypothetical protein WCQ91_04870, partial [Planctomycetota bacterium]